MDCSVVPLAHSGFSLVQTIDFFYPSVEDPFTNGEIACANVLSDLYAMGVTQCDNMLMVLAVSRNMSERQQDIVVPLLMKGINTLANEQGATSIRGGQTILNPWPIIGGVATACVPSEDIVMPDNAVAGDLLVLTKPLGTQVAVNAHQWLLEESTVWKDLLEGTISRHRIKKVYFRALDSMTRLNKTAASLMKKYDCHGCTDVTGFGILGHAQNLASVQKQSVDLIIDTLPIIRDIPEIVNLTGKFRKLYDGTSAETSGGLLMCIPASQAESLMRELDEIDGYPSWVVGRVVEGSRRAIITENVQILEVPVSAVKDDEDSEGSTCLLW